VGLAAGRLWMRARLGNAVTPSASNPTANSAPNQASSVDVPPIVSCLVMAPVAPAIGWQLATLRLNLANGSSADDGDRSWCPPEPTIIFYDM
jgi:hypothetical protein